MRKQSNIKRLLDLGRKTRPGMPSPLATTQLLTDLRPLGESPRPTSISNSPEAARAVNQPIDTNLEQRSRSPKRIDYAEYLQSEKWQKKRRQKLSAADWRCQICGSSVHLEVHHNTYARIGNEKMNDLIVLYRNCHQLVHSQRGKVGGSKPEDYEDYEDYE
jgi:5-methylcytosine-specific restriction endonuclease McrA